jgi:hypothetical protein
VIVARSVEEPPVIGKQASGVALGLGVGLGDGVGVAVGLGDGLGLAAGVAVGVSVGLPPGPAGVGAPQAAINSVTRANPIAWRTILTSQIIDRG